MSVAFRRESDEEHLEPKFELPLPPGPNLVTQRGLALMRARVAELEAAVEAETDAEAIKTLRRDLRYWRTRETSAEIAPVPEPGEVAFGTRVTYRMGGRTRTIDLVGADEADPASDRVTFTAPLAQAMIGAGDGETIDFGGRANAIEIVEAVPIPGDR